MEAVKINSYKRAKMKVEALKNFYTHFAVYVLFNSVYILIGADVFTSKPFDFSNWGLYVPGFFWGIGLISHGLYVLWEFRYSSILKKWEERKIRQILEEDNSHFSR